jgi:hypothetical protein
VLQMRSLETSVTWPTSRSRWPNRSSCSSCARY